MQRVFDSQRGTWIGSEEIIYERGGKCETCGGTSHLLIHHKTYEKGGILQVLCRRCHYSYHKFKGMHDWHRERSLK